MLFAHAPAGYLLTRVLSRTVFKDVVKPLRTDRLYQLIMFAGVLGSIFPDFDFIYHIFIDSDRTPHHAYFTHFPVFWLSLWVVLFAVGRWRMDRHFVAVVTVFCAGAMLHLTLDTLTGVIYWFAPLSHVGINVFKVADVHVWWVINYTDHWTFLVEIVIAAIAMAVFLRVGDAIRDVGVLFPRNGKLRPAILRLTVCALGVGVVVMVGSMMYSLDDRIVHKAKQLKHYIERIAFSS